MLIIFLIFILFVFSFYLAIFYIHSFCLNIFFIALCLSFSLFCPFPDSFFSQSLSLLCRTSRMTTPSWSTMWMQTTALPWRVICLRGPAMHSRHGIGTADWWFRFFCWVYCSFHNFYPKMNRSQTIEKLKWHICHFWKISIVRINIKVPWWLQVWSWIVKHWVGHKARSVSSLLHQTGSVKWCDLIPADWFTHWTFTLAVTEISSPYTSA